MNGFAAWVTVGVLIVIAMVTAMANNDHLSRVRDTGLQHEITRVELKQTMQYGSIQGSLGKIQMKLGIDD